MVECLKPPKEENDATLKNIGKLSRILHQQSAKCKTRLCHISYNNKVIRSIDRYYPHLLGVLTYGKQITLLAYHRDC